MKLLRIGSPGDERPVVMTGSGTILDAAPVAQNDFSEAFFAAGGMERLRAAVEAGRLPVMDLAGERIGPPIARPSKVVCIGLNYEDHAKETGAALPDEPVVFLKDPSTVVGPDDDLLLPVGSNKTDWEVELGVVIGASARYLRTEEEAGAVVAGYCLSHDVSERHFQLERGGQWTKGKSCESFNPLGPWLAEPSEITDVQSLELELSVNGHRVQSGSTKSMVFPVSYIVWYLSQFMVLNPGDLINTGTPAGVGMAKEPATFLGEGDVVRLSGGTLGSQEQTCRRAVR